MRGGKIAGALLGFLLLISLCCCEKPPVETQPALTQPVEITSVPTTAQAETTVPSETEAPLETTLPPETTDPPRVYVPQDPDPLSYPAGEYQGTLVLFAGMLYVHDNRLDTLLRELPKGFAFVGTSYERNSETSAKWALSTWHIPSWTEFYGSPDQPDYLYYKTEDGYRQMIRAALVENYWGGKALDPELPEDYLCRFFESILRPATNSRSVYAQTAAVEFSSPEQIDLGMLFYNGFQEDDLQNPITEIEKAFLEKENFTGIGDIKRLPADKMDGILKRFFAVSLNNTHKTGTENLLFWENTESYYVWRSDTRTTNALVQSVEHDVETDVYEITYSMEYTAKTYRIALQRVGDVFLIRSNLPVE